MGAPAVDRAIRILDFLTMHPGERFGLSELARRVQVSKASTYALLDSLLARGYVEKTGNGYQLGPALIPLGTMAERLFPQVEFAERESITLAESLDAEIIIGFITREDMLLLSHTGIPSTMSVTGQVGARMPLKPPMGAAFMAWSSDEDVEDWLSRLGPDAGEAERAHWLDVLRIVRRRGYSANLQVPAFVDLARALGEEASAAEKSAIDGALVEMAHHENYLLLDDRFEDVDLPIAGVNAPVFGSDARPCLTISIAPRHETKGSAVPEIAKELLKVTGRVTQKIGGRSPDSGIG